MRSKRGVEIRFRKTDKKDKLDIELFFSSLELNTNSQTDIMKKIPLNLVLRSIGKLFRVRLEGEKKQGTL